MFLTSDTCGYGDENMCGEMHSLLRSAAKEQKNDGLVFIVVFQIML